MFYTLVCVLVPKQFITDWELEGWWSKPQCSYDKMCSCWVLEQNPTLLQEELSPA